MSRYLKQYEEATFSGHIDEEGMPVLVNKMGVPVIPSLSLRFGVALVSIFHCTCLKIFIRCRSIFRDFTGRVFGI